MSIHYIFKFYIFMLPNYARLNVMLNLVLISQVYPCCRGGSGGVSLQWWWRWWLGHFKLEVVVMHVHVSDFPQTLHHSGYSLFLELRMMMRNTFLMTFSQNWMRFAGVKVRMLSGEKQPGEDFCRRVNFHAIRKTGS